ncbi:hypothetical protein SRS16CHR_02939 [Variovorax sp. SRS16]|uniref:hypothetical protein n=1 Tax=Variovorax sp. SRS16 TaxID=282217 RepID=UPI0013185053|nr:hypothetical protein [Variovorax sp. SRS16]VTU21903.1 hypothetical protein SRS16CHR_02939 [Variovorax sp. SRS16]
MADDIIHSHVILEWHFTPADFFGEPVTATREGYTWSLTDGKAEARIDGMRYAADEGIREQIHHELESRFRAAQVLRHQPFRLSGPNVTKFRADGTRVISMVLQAGAIKIIGHRPSVRIHDPAGNVVYDSEQASREKARAFENRVAGHSTDPLLGVLLRSFQAAVRDPDNELIHLYELRDALATRFGKDGEARAALGLTAKEWSRFGLLCNVEPLRQGRHRGENAGSLRDATEAELAEARTFGKKLLDGYLDVLDSEGA